MVINMTRTKLISALIVMLALAVSAQADGRVVSVLYFENTTGNADYAWLSKGLADMLITDLAAHEELTVVERDDLQKILREQERSVSDLFDEKTAVRIGKLVSAKEIVIGSYIIHNDGLRIDVKIVNVETGTVETGVRAEGKLGDLFTVQQRMTQDVLGKLGIQATGDGGPRETESLAAAKAYYTGIDLMDAGSFEEAAVRFREAAQIDPYYLKPQKSLEESYAFLKDFKRQRYQRELKNLYEKAAHIKRRLAAPEWRTYAQVLTDAYKQGLSQEEIKKLTEADPTLLQCDSRAQCTWELQHTLLNIADKSVEYFEDTETEKKMHREILLITDRARQELNDDPFFPEILYMELFSLKYFERWNDLRVACEHLMITYPDYRMMWAIENFYERALKELGGEDD